MDANGRSEALETQGTTLARMLTSSGTFAFVNETSPVSNKITRATGSFIDDGFVVGDVITTDSVANDGPFTITAVGALELTVSESVTDEAAVPVVISTEVLLGEMTDFDGPGGSASVIDVSHLLSTRKEKRMGLADEGQFTCNVNFLPGDRGQTLMRDDRAARSEQVFRLHLTDEDDSYLEFHAFVLGFAISGGVDAKVNGKLTLEITAEVTQETAA